MLAAVNNTSEIFNPAIEAFFMPVLFFEKNGTIRYSNKAAKHLLSLPDNNIAAQPLFSGIFCSETEENAWDHILRSLQHSNRCLQKELTIANVLICNAQFSPCNNFGEPLIQCAITHYEEFIEIEDELLTIPEPKPFIPFFGENLCCTLAKSVPNGVLVIFDKNLNYRLVEGQGLELMGFSSNINGHNFFKAHSTEYVEKFSPVYNSALDGVTSHLEYKSEEGHWFQLSVMPFNDGDKNFAGGLMIGFSIDNLKKAEQERDRKIEELWYTNNQLKIENGVRKLIERNMYEQKYELEQKNQELEQFAYVASHDLQEPLRMVSSYTQLLGVRYADKLDTEAKEFISFAVEGATRMQALITDLLSYSRVGRKEMSFEKINLDIVLQLVKRNLSILIDETGAELKFNDMPFVQADASQLVQLFQNLISNAIKFRKGSTKPVIQISAKTINKYHRIIVEDNGIGLNMEYKDRIFQIFQRLHTRDKYPGTGIGLAICKKIVERHGGQIWVESEIGNGTKFIFTLLR